MITIIISTFIYITIAATTTTIKNVSKILKIT